MTSIKTRSLLTTISCSVLFLCAACCTTPEPDGEVVVPWSSVPEAVQKTVTDQAGQQKIDKVEKETTNGTSIYEAKTLKKDGSHLVIKVDDQGKLIKVIKKSPEVKVSFAKLPKAVRATITKEAAGQKIEKVEKETVDGTLIYEACVLQKDNGHLIVKVGKTGNLISTKTK